MDTRVGRAIVHRRTMLADTWGLRAGDRKYGTQSGNQREYESNSQFHIPSIAADRTFRQDARIHPFVVWPEGFSLHNFSKIFVHADFFHQVTLRGKAEACIFNSKMNFASSRFSFTFRYWHTVAASAE